MIPAMLYSLSDPDLDAKLPTPESASPYHHSWSVPKFFEQGEENEERNSYIDGKWDFFCATALINERYLYFHCSHKSLPTRTFLTLNLETFQAKFIELDKDFERFSYSQALVAHDNNLILFGRQKTDGVAKDQQNDYLLFIFGNSFERCDIMNYEDSSFSSRYGYSLDTLDTNIFLFGGIVNEEYSSDLLFINLQGLPVAPNESSDEKKNIVKWSQIPLQSASPPGRCNHATTVVGYKLIIHGGKNQTGLLGDLWLFDLETVSWTEIRPVGNFPCPREGHKVVSFGNKLYMYGGFDESGAICKDLWCFNLDKQCWSRTKGPSIAENNPIFLNMACYNERLFLIFSHETHSSRRFHSYECDPASLSWDDMGAYGLPVFNHVSMYPSNASSNTISLGNFKSNHTKNRSNASFNFYDYLEPTHKAVQSTRHRHYGSLDEQGLKSLKELKRNSLHHHRNSDNLSLREFGHSSPFAYDVDNTITSLPIAYNGEEDKKDNQSLLSIPDHVSNRSANLQAFHFNSTDDRIAWLEEQLLYCMTQGYALKPPGHLKEKYPKGILYQSQPLKMLESLHAMEEELSKTEYEFKQNASLLISENAQLLAEKDAAQSSAKFHMKLLQESNIDSLTQMLSERVHTLEVDVQHSLAEATSYYQRYNELKQKVEEMQFNNAMMRNHQAELTENYAKLQSIIEEDSSKAVSLQTENKILKLDVSRLSQESLEFHSKCQTLEYTNYELETKLIELCDRMEMQTNVIEASASALDVSNTAILSFEDSLRREKEENKIKQEKYLSLTYQSSRLNAEVERLQIENSELQKTTDQVRSDAAYLKSIVQNGLSKLLSSEIETKESHQDSPRTNQKIKYLESRLVGMQKLFEKQQNRLETTMLEMVSVQRKYAEMKHAYSVALIEKGELLSQMSGFTEKSKGEQSKLFETQRALADSKLSHNDYDSRSTKNNSYEHLLHQNDLNSNEKSQEKEDALSKNDEINANDTLFKNYQRSYNNLISAGQITMSRQQDTIHLLNLGLEDQKKRIIDTPNALSNDFSQTVKVVDDSQNENDEQLRSASDIYYANRIKQLEDDYQKAITYANCSDESFQQLNYKFI
ncbi:cell end marker Tea3 [Schizosaccharomyces cryophilus OY26]|uniref:Cell end marker Tea3 n=1 Tax=Schizosaccharomyces cryophilus (strain OY26 / ATCC MYA-4695 / CBS 11777 / NBRC 106824 / NRRL Y48691) TaxID=653667 RepID=S9X517_SCHCR|nr:cell end marker Tea3 [Schizosaccharomyces cryophilus OY26]EPY52177.1 cell end marker Tea3 [Schizosaccharomyces cryophilus OY26]